MTTTVSREEFYGNRDRVSTPFGEEGAIWVRGFHAGTDITYLRSRGETSLRVPALLGGTVVRRGHRTDIGGYIILQVGAKFHGYCHMYEPSMPALGAVIATGGDLGEQATTSAAGGSQWSGTHTHLTVSSNVTALYDGSPVDNSDQAIAAALLSTAGLDTTQIGDTVFYLRNNESGEVRAFGTPEGSRRVTPEAYSLLVTLGANTAAPDLPGNPADVFGVYEDIWSVAVSYFGTGPTSSSPTLTDAQLAKIGAAVKPADLTPVLTAIAALDKQDDEYQAKLEAILAKGLTGTLVVKS